MTKIERTIHDLELHNIYKIYETRKKFTKESKYLKY